MDVSRHARYKNKRNTVITPNAESSTEGSVSGLEMAFAFTGFWAALIVVCVYVQTGLSGE